jgi:hypothetical protein
MSTVVLQVLGLLAAHDLRFNDRVAGAWQVNVDVCHGSSQQTLTPVSSILTMPSADSVGLTVCTGICYTCAVAVLRIWRCGSLGRRRGPSGAASCEAAVAAPLNTVAVCGKVTKVWYFAST